MATERQPAGADGMYEGRAQMRRINLQMTS